MKNAPIIPLILTLIIAVLAFVAVENRPGSGQLAASSYQQKAESRELTADNPEEIPANSLHYSIDNAKAYYAVQKRFLKQADQKVIGTNNNLQGDGWYKPEEGYIYLNLNFDFKDFYTDAPKRDEDVLKYFENTEINVQVNAEELDIMLAKEFDIQIPVLLTINNVQRVEIFDVEGYVEETGYNASGETKIFMSDYNVDTPSLANVFTVDDEMDIWFEISGTLIKD